ncbi:MAG: hypothetical protein JSW15_07195 [Deltaproteobacteria bacterium]|nr:MAG: hypothetical protein JSW15_07195 [Deltaproteobacteria bacterium]
MLVIKSKIGWLASMGIMTLILATVLAFVSCAPTGPAPTVGVTPNQVAIGETASVAGANFKPGEKLTIAIQVSETVENLLYRPPGDPAKGLGLEVAESGSFEVKTRVPRMLSPGTYPVKIYSEKRKLLASTEVTVVSKK